MNGRLRRLAAGHDASAPATFTTRLPAEADDDDDGASTAAVKPTIGHAAADGQAMPEHFKMNISIFSCFRHIYICFCTGRRRQHA